MDRHQEPPPDSPGPAADDGEDAFGPRAPVAPEGDPRADAREVERQGLGAEEELPEREGLGAQEELPGRYAGPEETT